MNSRKSIINQSYFAIGVVAFFGLVLLSGQEEPTTPANKSIEIIASNSSQPEQLIKAEIRTLSESEVRSMVGQ